MPGNNQGSTSMDHERKARLRAAVEKAKLALQRSDAEEKQQAPEPAKEQAPTPEQASEEKSRLAELEANKEAWRASREEDYAARYPGSPIPRDPVVAYRALHQVDKHISDEEIQKELETQGNAYDKIQAEPDRYEEFLSRRALPEKSNVVDKRKESRREFHDNASVVEAEERERKAAEYTRSRGVPGRYNGTKAEELNDASAARQEAIDAAKKSGEVATEDGPRSRIRMLAERAAAQLGPPTRAAAEMAGSSMAGAPNVSSTFEPGSKIDNLKAAAKVAMKRFGGK